MSASYSPLRNHNKASPVDNTDVSANKPNRNAEIRLNAPIAKTEIDDEIDDREVVNKPYPGVDDGFFNGTSKDEHPDVESIDPKQPGPGRDVEVIPAKPRDPEPVEPSDEIPVLRPRIGPDDKSKPDDKNTPDDDDKNTPDDDDKNTPDDDIDERNDDPKLPLSPRPRNPFFRFGFGRDPEIGSIPGDFPESIPDVNIYQHKKTLAQGMMDLALFSANANQLRYVLESFSRHPYYYPSIIFISISLLLQIAVGVGLIWNATYNVKDRKEICIANKISNFTIIGIFMVTVINVFISAFGVANPTRQ